MIAHGPAVGVGYYLWRRCRLTLFALLADLAVWSVLIHLLSPDSPAWFRVLAALPAVPAFFFGVQLLGDFTYGQTDFAMRGSAFPAHMLVLPVRTWALALLPMLYGSAIVLGLSWLVMAAVLIPAGVAMPLATVVGFLVACLAWFQALAWFPFPVPIVRAVATVTVILVLVGFGAALNALGHAPATILAGDAAFTALAYALAIAGLRLGRRGDAQAWRWPGRAPRAWRDTVLSALPAWRRPFASPAAAHLWYECRRNVPLLPAMVAALCAWMLFPVLGKGGEAEIALGPVQVPVRVMVIGFALTFAPLAGAAFSTSLGKFDLWSGKVPTFSSFFATRPLASAEFVRVKLQAAAICTALTWVPVLALFAVGVATTGPGGRPTALPAGLSPDALGLSPTWLITLTLALLVFLTWRNIVVGFYAPLCGRAWVTNAAGVATWTLIGLVWAVGVWLYHRPGLQGSLAPAVPWLIGGVAALKVSIAVALCVALRRSNVIRPRTIRTWAGVWLAIVICASTALCAKLGATPLALAGPLLVLPFNRLALAPLALHWNRHR